MLGTLREETSDAREKSGCDSSAWPLLKNAGEFVAFAGEESDDVAMLEITTPRWDMACLCSHLKGTVLFGKPFKGQLMMNLLDEASRKVNQRSTGFGVNYTTEEGNQVIQSRLRHGEMDHNLVSCISSLYTRRVSLTNRNHVFTNTPFPLYKREAQ